MNERLAAQFRRHWGWLLAVGAAILFPFLVDSPYVTHTITLFLMYSILAMGLSVVVAYAGLLDIGYVAFFAVGAYFYAVLNTTSGLPFLFALPLAGCLAALAGVVLGFPTLRVRGDYLALVTLAFGEMVRQVLQNWTAVTGGPKGIPAVDSPSILGMKATLPWEYYLIVLAFTVASVLVLKRIGRSPMAMIWEAIRDDETAARSCGIDSTRWLLLAFAIGAFFAGLVGVFFAAIQRFVSPETFVLDESILILSIVVLARGKSLPRIFLAAAILFGLPEILRAVHEYRTLAFGLLLVGFTVIDFKLLKRRRPGSTLRARDDEMVEMESQIDAPYPDALRDQRGVIERVAVHQVLKSFSGLKALNRVSFDVSCDGKIIALVGPNGAGKTTLFDCISGLQVIDEGRISVSGIGELTGFSPHRIATSGVARTFQRVRLFSTMTVRQNVEIGGYCGLRIPVAASLVPGLPLKRFASSYQKRVEDAMALVGIDAHADAPVTSLPIGIQRKVEIARALATRPRMLLLDEVASGLNDGEKRSLAATLRHIADHGRIAIVLVEHDIAFVSSLADHMIVLDAGEVLTEGLPGQVIQDKRVIESYLGAGGGERAVST